MLLYLADFALQEQAKTIQWSLFLVHDIMARIQERIKGYER